MNPATSQATTRAPTGMSIGKLVLAFAIPTLALILLAWVDRNDAWNAIPRNLLSKILGCGYILFAALGVYRFICTLLIDRVIAGSRKRPLPRLLRHLVTVSIAILAGLLIAYSVAPGAFSGILALSSVMGVVLGLALKPLILDVFSGISTNLDSAFQIGDWIEIGSRSNGSPNSGWVEEINWRTTHIRTRNGNLIICPNSYVGTAVISNYSRPTPMSRVDTFISLPVEAEVARCLRVLQAAVDATADMEGGCSSEHPGKVMLAEVKEGMAIYEIRCWIDYTKQSVSDIRHIVLRNALRHLRIAGIPLAEPAVMNRENREILDNTSSKDIPRLLTQIRLFRGLSDEDLQQLATSLVAHEFSPADVLVSQGDGGTDMFVIIEGAVEVIANVDGRDISVAHIQAGDYFGEMAMLTGETRTATVRATTHGKIWQIPRDGMAGVLDGDAHLMELISRNLADRNLNRTIRIEASHSDISEERRHSLAASILAKMKEIFRAVR